MLRKLLKYDFKAVIKFWAIGALAVLLMSIGGGLCQRIMEAERPVHMAVQIIAGLGFFLSTLTLYAFSLMTFVLVAMRIYKNFFTDEGYLTFTLPVKIHTAINSKMIMAVTMTVLSVVWMGISLVARLAVATPEFFQKVREFFDGLAETIDLLKMQGYLGWAIFYIVELLLLCLLGTVFSQLFTGNCITFGAVVAKKAKLVAAIAIYYVSNYLFSIVIAIFLVCGMTAFSLWIVSAALTETQTLWLVALLLLGANGLLAMLCGMLYTLQYRLLDRKLNLP